MTPEELKLQIDIDITNKTSARSITPTNVGKNMKDVIDLIPLNPNTLATNVSVSPVGGIAATNVQSALQELDSETVKLTGDQTIAGIKTFQNVNLKSTLSPTSFAVNDLAVAGNLNGTYTYAITYYTVLGETESSGEVSISVVNSQVNVNLPISSDPLVIGRRVYRTIGTPFDTVIKSLVVDIANNVATSYTDNIADGSLGVSLSRVNTTGGQLFLNNERIGFASNLSTSFGRLSFTNNTGYADTGFGYGVFTSNTTGYRNTAMGTFAMRGNTTGYNNTAMGVHSLDNNTVGRNNTGLGYATLMGNIDGISNVAVGNVALTINSSGSQNIAIGESSLMNNLASNNTAIGHNSMMGNSNGTQNVAVGGESLRDNSSGNFNVAIGFQSLKANNDSFNTVIGYSSARDAVLGGGNSIFGEQAGLNAVGYGNVNTLIGGEAGFNLSGSSNVFLGYQSGYYETGSNKLFIDNIKRANEADARTKALVYGVFDTSPSNQTLTINGNLSALTYTGGATLTDVPTAPTATVGTDTDQIATTKFVQSQTETNPTTTVLSSATLTATYPTAIRGFKVHALDIAAGGRIYEKTSTGWCEYLSTIVV